MRKDDGFSLIELLIVIAVIGLLTTSLITLLRYAKQSANNGAAQSITRGIVNLSEINRSDNLGSPQYITATDCVNNIISVLPSSVIDCKLRQDLNTSYILVRSSSGAYFYFDGMRMNGPLQNPPTFW